LKELKSRVFLLARILSLKVFDLLDKVKPMQWCDSKKENERKEEEDMHAREKAKQSTRE
jgi:hypothetical protein